MTDQKANLVAKRQPQQTNEPTPEPKHPRIDDGEGPATNTTMLTDVVDDCLERIFMLLSVEELLNIAHTNKELKPAADMAFERKFGKMEFQLKDNRRYYYSNGDGIKIDDKKTQLRLLRCFGPLIRNLDIHQSGEFVKKLVGSANEYCFDSLISIKIREFYIRNNLLQKPFANVDIVELERCRLYADTNFKKWFPAMRHLELNWCSTFTNRMFIVKHIPQLEHLKIYSTCIPAEHICTSLRNNPQLRSLILDGIVLPKDFWKTCQTLSQLESLQVESAANFKNVDTALNFPALKKVDIRIEENDLRLMVLEENVITFGQLEDITLRFIYHSLQIDSHNWSSFFKRNQSIEKVTLWLYLNDVSTLETIMNKIAQELPLLKEFNYFPWVFSCNEILGVIEKFNLMSYGFRLFSSDFNDLKKRLSTEWDASIDGHGVKVIRKM